MLAAMRSDGLLTDAGWPTTPDQALHDGSDAARTTINTDTLDLYGFDFSDLEAVITVTGVQVVVDAAKIDSGGTSDLKFLVALSWDSGSSFTATKVTPVVTATPTEYVLGLPNDTWGHTWTRAELVGVNTFRMRITSTADVINGTPTWLVYYARPTVYYNATGSATLAPIQEPVAFGERIEVSPDVIRIFEPLAVLDSGSVPSGRVVDRRSQQLKLSGTAVSTLQSSAGFPSAALKPQHREAIGCRITSGENDLDLFIGDATLLGSTAALNYPGTHMQPGLLDLGEIAHEATFGSAPTRATAELRLQNRRFVNQLAGLSGAGLTPNTLSTHLTDKTIIGGSLTVWSFVQSGANEAWEQLVIFHGTIEEFDFEESATTVRAVTIGTGAHPVPDVFVDSSLFTYEPGSSGVDTGEEIEGNRGKPVPVGIGRFDYGAIKKPADFATGHPFRTNQQGALSEHEKVYTQIALLPAMWGLKHPMMPTVHVAKRFRRKNAEVGDLQFTSWPYQNVFLYGSRKSQPHLGVMTGPSPAHFKNFRFPGRGLPNYSKNAGENEVELATIWTWGETGHPFAIPISGAHYGSGDAAIPFWAVDHQGAGGMDLLGYPFARGPNWSDGRALDCFGVFVNGQTPRAGALFPEIQGYPVPRQAVAIPMSGPTQFETRTRIYFHGGPANPMTPVFQNLEGTGQGFVENFRNAIDLLKVEDSARLQNMGSMSMRLPLDGPRLGAIRGIKFCVLWNSSTTTAQNVYLLARLGPHNNYAIIDATIIPDYEFFNKDINVAFNKADLDDTAGGFVHCYKLANLTTATYGSIWLLPFFNPFERIPVPMSTRAGPPVPFATPEAEWNFTCEDRITLSSATNADFPWDAMILVRDLSGGTPIANRYIDIVAAWLEVHYDSPALRSTHSPDVAGGITRSQRTAFPGFDDIPGRRLPVTFTVSRLDPAFNNQPEAFAATVFVTGKGAQDDASGTITGTASAIIEHPADIAQTLLRHYGGEAVFAARATGSSFGSFTTARTLLGSAYRLSAVFTGDDLKGALEQIARQSKSIIVEDLDTLGDLHWRMFVDDFDPAANNPARMYRADAFRFSLDHMAVGTFVVSLSPIEDLASSVRLRFGFHLPSGTWSDEKYCTPTAHNFTTNGSFYMTALAESRRSNGTARELRVDAPDVWDPVAAEILAKWHASRSVIQRVVVRFETYANGMDLQIGHVIRMDSSIASRIEYPGGPYGTSWNLGQFNVVHVSHRKDGGQMARVVIVAEETAPLIA